MKTFTVSSDEEGTSSQDTTFIWIILLAIFLGGFLLALVLFVQAPSSSTPTVEEDSILDEGPTLHPASDLSPNMETAPAIPGTTAPVTPDNPDGPDQ